MAEDGEIRAVEPDKAQGKGSQGFFSRMFRKDKQKHPAGETGMAGQEDKVKAQKDDSLPEKQDKGQGSPGMARPGFLSKVFKRDGLKHLTKEMERADSKEKEKEKTQKDVYSLKPEASLKKDALKMKEKLRKARQPRHKMKYFAERAGLTLEEHFVSRRIFVLTVIFNVLISIYATHIYLRDYRAGAVGLFIWIVLLWMVFFGSLILFSWLVFYVYLDLRAHKRRMMVEEVFPDFLQLASANIRAGMPLDRALWFAVRPRFGILSNEIETIAKDVISGTDLEVALVRFSDKYDSPTVKRSITLLIEGMKSGGEVGDLLNKIALNIQERQILQREMGADVMSYAMFIGIASLLAAPFLFALSGQLLSVLTNIMGSVSQQGGISSASSGVGGGGMGLSFSEVTLSQGDYRKFAIIALTITSSFAGAITATIRKGEVKKGISQIPVYIAISITLFLIASMGFGSLFGGLF